MQLWREKCEHFSQWNMEAKNNPRGRRGKDTCRTIRGSGDGRKISFCQHPYGSHIVSYLFPQRHFYMYFYRYAMCGCGCMCVCVCIQAHVYLNTSWIWSYVWLWCKRSFSARAVFTPNRIAIFLVPSSYISKVFLFFYFKLWDRDILKLWSHNHHS